MIRGSNDLRVGSNDLRVGSNDVTLFLSGRVS